MSRLEALADLKDGWNGPRSKAIHPRAFANYAALVAVFDDRIPRALEPMPWDDGGVNLEWDRGEWTYFADIQPGGGMYLCKVGPVDDDSQDEDHTYLEFDAAIVRKFYETGRIEVAE